MFSLIWESYVYGLLTYVIIPALEHPIITTITLVSIVGYQVWQEA